MRSSLKKSGSLKGEIIYDDLSSREKPLISWEYMITGKPDRIMKVRNKYIPIEYKSSSREKPEMGHLLQLGAYFIIIEEELGEVPYGFLEYKNRSFKVKNNDEIRRMVIERVADVRNNNNPHRNHNNPGKCAKCPFKTTCQLSLLK